MVLPPLSKSNQRIPTIKHPTMPVPTLATSSKAFEASFRRASFNIPSTAVDVPAFRSSALLLKATSIFVDDVVPGNAL